MNRERADAVPVAPYMGNHGARVAGEPIGEYCRSGRRMAAAQWRAWERYQQDALVPQSDNYYIAEGFGTRVQHYPDATPTLLAPAIEGLTQVDRLRLPRPETDGRMPVYLEAIARLADRSADTVAVRAPGTGPFSLASHLLGSEQFLIELALAGRQPDGAAANALRRLLEMTADALIAFARACLEAGAHLVQAGDSLASPDMISPRMYRDWVFPAEQRFFHGIREEARRRGAMTVLHICGNTDPILELMADTGADILELDAKVDLARAKARIGDRVCLMGNLDPVGVLLQGTPGDVEAAAGAAMAAVGTAGGFILGSGCEVPIDAPEANLHAMIASARKRDESGRTMNNGRNT